ncbi:hypothetical protein AB1N83_008451, partial [Pleurotus pulmonarius]
TWSVATTEAIGGAIINGYDHFARKEGELLEPQPRIPVPRPSIPSYGRRSWAYSILELLHEQNDIYPSWYMFYAQPTVVAFVFPAGDTTNQPPRRYTGLTPSHNRTDHAFGIYPISRLGDFEGPRTSDPSVSTSIVPSRH